MTMTSLIEDCQAWIDKGNESWKSYFSKWETFAEYEETLTESELIQENSDKPKERRNKKKLPASQKKIKRVLLKNQKRRQNKLIRKEKSGQKATAEIKNQMLQGSLSDGNLFEIIEDQQLEITLRTVFSNFLKTHANKYEMFSVLFQTFTGGEMIIQDLDHLFPKKQLLLHSNFETNLSFNNQQVLSSSVPKPNLIDRSICPPRNVYLQSVENNTKEIHSELIQRNWRQWGNPSFGAGNTNNFSKYNYSKQLCSSSNDCQTPQIRRNLEVAKPTLPRFRNMQLKFIQFDSRPKFSKSFCHDKEHIRRAPIPELNTTPESKRFGNLCLQQRTNRLSLSLDNINFKTSLRKSTEIKGIYKMPFRRRHPSTELISDSKESDSDSDDLTIFRSPLVHENKRLKVENPHVDALEPDVDDCQHIFDRVVKS